jgi:hypothetical protein
MESPSYWVGHYYSAVIRDDQNQFVRRTSNAWLRFDAELTTRTNGIKQLQGVNSTL